MARQLRRSRTRGNAAREQRESQHDAEIRQLAEARSAEAGALLPILHAIQDRLGYVPESGGADRRRGPEPVARRGARRRQLLSLLPHQAAGPADVVRLPRRGLPGDGLARAREHARKKLGVDFHETTADGRSVSSRSTAWATARARRP